MNGLTNKVIHESISKNQRCIVTQNLKRSDLGDRHQYGHRNNHQRTVRHLPFDKAVAEALTVLDQIQSSYYPSKRSNNNQGNSKNNGGIQEDSSDILRYYKKTNIV